MIPQVEHNATDTVTVSITRFEPMLIEAYLEPCQISYIERFSKIVNGFQPLHLKCPTVSWIRLWLTVLFLTWISVAASPQNILNKCHFKYHLLASHKIYKTHKTLEVIDTKLSPNKTKQKYQGSTWYSFKVALKSWKNNHYLNNRIFQGLPYRYSSNDLDFSNFSIHDSLREMYPNTELFLVRIWTLFTQLKL